MANTGDNESVSDAASSALDDPFDVMLIGWSFVRSKLLMAAVELNLFEELRKEPGTVSQLMTRLDLNERGARDFLDALTALGLIERTGDVYRNSPAAARHLIPGQQGYVGGFLAMTTEFMGAGWESLTAMLRTGKAHGQESGAVPFAKVFRDPTLLRHFLSAMDALNGAIGGVLAQSFNWSEYTSFADIGGARGNLAAQLLQAYPHLRGIVFDRPAMRQFADELAAANGVSSRLTFHGGDFFTDELPAADIIIFGNVLHDCPVEARRELIQRAHDKVSPGGAVIVYDPMIDDERLGADNLLLSLSMMLQSPAGNEYTPADCQEWMRAAGLEIAGAIPLPAHATAVIGRKPVSRAEGSPLSA